MLTRSILRPMARQAMAPVRLTRSFTHIMPRLQQQQELPGKLPGNSDKPQGQAPHAETGETKAKRRPLSRVAVGGESGKLYKAGNLIEFASWKAVMVLIVVGGGFTWWFSREKERLRIQKEVELKRSYGKPLIGGPFKLIDTNNQEFTNKNLINDKKEFSILYFGFTHCPDVCPDELDKLGEMLETLRGEGITLKPIFITCDPARDSPEIIKEYLEDFDPSIIGLTGSYENVKNACKQYRVYFSTPPDVKPGQDYLVDHLIFFYLMDPEGQFVDVIGREATAPEGVDKIKSHIDAFIPAAEREARKEGMFGFLFK